MASLVDIRRRLRSVKSTQQITKAMKMVAAAKLRRAQERVVGARPYAKLLSAVLAKVAAHAAEVAHPLLEIREEKRVIVMTIAGDRGLAGAFNTNVNKATLQLLAAHPEWKEIRILPVGKKAVEFWRRRKYTLTEKTYSGIFATLQYANAKEIAAFLSEEFLADRIDAVYVIVNEFRSILSQVVHTSKLLPLSPEAAAAPSAEGPGVDYIYEPDAATILAKLLPRYLEFTVYRALAESAAAEMGAKMTAMDSASKNAGDLIDKLTLTYNRARQARITKELIEIVSGAAALE
ncbi:MAG: ATP synthase F1 subunit gamma [Acidobacteriota bacterium]